MLCPVEEHLATAGAVTTVQEHLGLAAQKAEEENSLLTVEEQLAHIFCHKMQCCARKVTERMLSQQLSVWE